MQKIEIWVNSSYAFFLLIVALWRHMALQNLANIGSGNGLMPEGITGTNVDLSLVSYCGILLRAIS